MLVFLKMENYMNIEQLDMNSLNEKLKGLSLESDIRKAKIEFLKENNIIPYIEKFERTHSLSEVNSLAEGEKVKVAGRVILEE